MASLRFYDLGANCPTNAGALLFARDPLRWVPGAWIQFVRWAGKTIGRPDRSAACQQCHRPGSVAPMALLTYEQNPVRPWARAIRDKTAQREAEFTFETSHVLATIWRAP